MATHDPYTPPKAPVSMPEAPVSAVDMPGKVKLGVGMLALLVLVELILATLLVLYALSQGTKIDSAEAVVFIVGVLALEVFLIWMSWKRKGWARYGIVLLWVVGAIDISLPTMTGLINFFVIWQWISLAWSLVALVLLFSPSSSAWYRHKP